MKTIKDLTEQDCIHCRTQEEWDGVLKMLNNYHGIESNHWGVNKENSYLKLSVYGYAVFCDLDYARHRGYTIHPASDFLTPQVSVLTEIGDTKVIRYNDGCIVIKDDKAMTLTKDIVNWIKQNI